MISCDTEISGL